ncbi:hypothetical protein [Cellulomonas hominis]
MMLGSMIAEHRSGRAVLGLLCTTAILAGCTDVDTSDAGQTSQPVAPSGLVLGPVLDETTGAVILPYDRFVASHEEIDQLAAAGTVLLSICARAAGVGFLAPDVSFYDTTYDSEEYFGPWTVGQAERFGFVMPMTDADLIANGIVPDTIGYFDRPPHPNTALTEQDWEVVDACEEPEGADQFDEPQMRVGPWEEQIRAIDETLARQPDVVTALDELAACYAEVGLEPDPEQPWRVEGADGGVISEEQVRLALQVVDCKTRVDFTARVARVHADLQAPIIVEYADELVAKRERIDAAVAAARVLIAENDDLIYHRP